MGNSSAVMAHHAAVLATATAAAEAHGIWPLGEAATDWLVDPSRIPAQVTRTDLGDRRGYTISVRGDVDLLAPDPQVAAVQLRALERGRTVWARGLTSPIRTAALATDWYPTRRLLLLHTDLGARTAPRWPAGYELLAFQPGVDELDWLAANRAAFPHLPDQGSWQLADLRLRLAATWFDPAAFLILRAASGEVAGFVWAKVRGTPADSAHEGGEIYVIAVQPHHRGLGLGRELTRAGLAVIHAAGHNRAHLYVDSGNVAAIGLYRRLGFTNHEEVLALCRPASAG